MDGNTRTNEQLARVQEEQAGVLAQQAETLAEIRKSLLSLEERGSEHNSEQVTDLEKRLTDAEAENAETVRGLEARLDEFRLALAGSQAGGTARVKCAGIIGDLEEAKRAIHSWAHLAMSQGDPNAMRAIDTTVLSNGGALQPETYSEFLDYVTDAEASILGRVETQPMIAPQFNLDRIAVAKRSMRATTENQALPVADSVTTGQRVLTSVGTGWTEDISLEFLEDNIERADAESKIAQLCATEFRNDAADLGINGDGSTAPFLSMNEGWVYMMRNDPDVNDTDLTGAANPSELLRQMYSALPANLRAFPGHRFTVPVGFANHYADTLATRETALGDAVQLGGLANLRWFGLPVTGDFYMSETTLGVESADAAFLTPDSNLVWGVQRGIEIYLEFKPRTRQVELTIHARHDYQHKWGGIIVLGSNIPAGLLS